MEYYNTDAFGNVIYIDEITNELYSFVPDEIKDKLLEDYPWDPEHMISEFTQTNHGKPIHCK